jgi:flagellar basal-body rod protein FlgB
MRAFEGISTTDLLQKAMSIREERHRVIAGNIANLNTPGYRPGDINFRDTLDRALSGRAVFYGTLTHPRHIPIINKRPVVMESNLQLRSDRSGVDIDYEMGELTKNTALYSTYGTLLRRRFQLVSNMLRNLR